MSSPHGGQNKDLLLLQYGVGDDGISIIVEGTSVLMLAEQTPLYSVQKTQTLRSLFRLETTAVGPRWMWTQLASSGITAGAWLLGHWSRPAGECRCHGECAGDPSQAVLEILSKQLDRCGPEQLAGRVQSCPVPPAPATPWCNTPKVALRRPGAAKAGSGADISLPRLFVGLALSDASKQGCERLVKQLQREHPGASLAVQWSRPPWLHFTVRFIGTASWADARRLEEILDSVAAGTKPFQLVLARGGVFYSRGRPSTFWVGLPEDDGGRSEFRRLAEAVAGACFRLAYRSTAGRKRPMSHLGACDRMQHSCLPWRWRSASCICRNLCSCQFRSCGSFAAVLMAGLVSQL